MTKGHGRGSKESRVSQRTDPHSAVTVARNAADVFGGVTRAMPQPGAWDVDADSSQMTSVWIAPLREVPPTEALGRPSLAATVVQMPGVVRPTGWRTWLVALLVGGLLAAAGAWCARDMNPSSASKRAPVAPVAPTIKERAVTVIQAQLSAAERARAEADAAAALIAGHRVSALQHYRRLATGTHSEVFARAVRILEAMP